MTTASRSPSHVATCMAALLLSSSIACGGKSGASPPTTDDGGTAVTLTAALVSAESASPAAARFASAAATTALEAWILRCTTYTTPALSAYGTSDRLGVVSLVLPAGSRTAPFGCHVEDPTGAQVAVMELADGLSTVRTIAVPGDTDLGPLAVDAASGTALGTVPAGAIVRPAISAACPSGSWVMTGTDGACGFTTFTVTVETNLTATLDYAPWVPSSECPSRHLSGYTATYQTVGGVSTLVIDLPTADPTCEYDSPGRLTFTIDNSPSGACGSASVEEAATGCESCGTLDGPNVCYLYCWYNPVPCTSCGSTTCVQAVLSAERH